MKKGFTLIELLAVIVVLAILALVVTPIVLNIVENAQTGSDERSLEQYAKVMQTSYYEEKMKDTTLTLASYLESVDTGSGVSLTYNGSRVFCNDKVAVVTDDGAQTIELSNCMINGRGPYKFVNGKAEKDDVYKNGEIIYFDVLTGEVCSESDYYQDNSKTGYNGFNTISCSFSSTTYEITCSTTQKTATQSSCLKFYAFNDTNENENLNLLLDHNTTSIVAWNSRLSSKPSEVLERLDNDTKKLE